MEEARLYKCPRCEVEVMTWIEGKDCPEGGALSLMSRREGDASIIVCATCGDREGLRAEHLPDDPLPQPEDWPVSIDELLIEDRLRYLVARRGEVRTINLDELDG
jgi:hypothetical protein